MLRSIFAVTFALLVSASAVAQEAGPSFCERMAAELKLEPTTSKKYYDGRPTWRINKLGGIGTVLFGGSSFIVLQAGTDQARTPADFQRISQTCQALKGTIMCRLSAPDHLTVSVDEHSAMFRTEPDERAEVEVVKASVICRDGWPAGLAAGQGA